MRSLRVYEGDTLSFPFLQERMVRLLPTWYGWLTLQPQDASLCEMCDYGLWLQIFTFFHHFSLLKLSSFVHTYIHVTHVHAYIHACIHTKSLSAHWLQAILANNHTTKSFTSCISCDFDVHNQIGIYFTEFLPLTFNPQPLPFWAPQHSIISSSQIPQ